MQGTSDLVARSIEQLTRALADLLRRAVSAGEIRGDVGPEDRLRALVGMCYAQDRPDRQASVVRLIDILVDGLRRPADADRTRRRPDPGGTPQP